MKENITEALEGMIDRHGLLHVVTALELICAEKSEHIRANWQDRTTAKPWDAASRKLGALAAQVSELGI